jgi:hypothetical protein
MSMSRVMQSFYGCLARRSNVARPSATDLRRNAMPSSPSSPQPQPGRERRTAASTATAPARGGQMQPMREFLPSKSKQNEAKILGFAWSYSPESGLFKGLRAKK